MKYFLVLFTLLSFQSLAHVKMGIYQGQTENNEKCEVEIKEKWYTENFKHPLNERVEVYFELAKAHFTLVHPPTYILEKERVFFNHDILAQTISTKVGANAFILHMIHRPDKKGPGSFQYIQDNWRDPSKNEVLNCNDLKFMGPKKESQEK